MDEMLKFSILTCLSCWLLICAKADYAVKCNNNSVPSISFEPSEDGVKGRYTVVWCTDVDKNVTEWDLLIRFYESRKPEKCKTYDLRHPPPLGLAHSHLRQNVNLNPNCSNACFSTSVDLIFSACYTIKNMLFRGSHSSEGHDSFHYIRNNFTNITTLRSGTPAVKFVNYDDYVSAMWFLGYVPAVNFTMDVCRLNTTLPQETCEDVTQNCTAELYRISCDRLRLERGAYAMRLSHHAPWVYGRITVQSALSDFEHYGLPEVVVGVGEGRAVGQASWVAPLVAAAAALVVLALLLVYRAGLSARLRRSVLAAWLHNEQGEAPKTGAEEGVRIVLLYARDCAAMMEVAQRLRALLALVAPGKVIDLYSSVVAAQAAAAPGDWLRSLLARDDVRVLLLQTPAAACLYSAALKQRGAALALQRPLLGGRVVARTPHCADAMLHLALRFITDSALTQPDSLPYKKYFVAEIPGLEADLVPLVTPQRRYALPQSAALLLRDLAPCSPWAQQFQQLEQLQQLDPLLEAHLEPLRQAIEHLLDYISDHPDYLNDELLFL